MINHGRIVAAVLAAITVLVVLSSSVFIIEHADHDCVGEDCPVCEQICSCTQNLKTLSIALLTSALIVALTFSLCTGVKRLASVYVPRTPVFLKVKLSD